MSERMTGKKAVLEMLLAEGVEYIFGNPGTSEGSLRRRPATQECRKDLEPRVPKKLPSRKVGAYPHQHIEVELAKTVDVLAFVY